MPPWLIAVASLPAAFAVAQVTGVRPLGGLVLVALAAAAVVSARAGAARAGAWVAVLLACFAVSHVLADPLGPWGAVALVSAVTGAAGLLLLDRRRPLRAAVEAGR